MATRDRGPITAPNSPKMLDFRSLRLSTRRKAPEIHGFFRETGDRRIARNVWLTPQSPRTRLRERNSVFPGKKQGVSWVSATLAQDEQQKHDGRTAT